MLQLLNLKTLHRILPEGMSVSTWLRMLQRSYSLRQTVIWIANIYPNLSYELHISILNPTWTGTLLALIFYLSFVILQHWQRKKAKQ